MTSRRLGLEFARLLVEPGHGGVWHAPLGVHFPGTGEGVQPDILFVSNERRGILAPDELKGAHDLVVEILSPGTAGRDRGVKLRLYLSTAGRQRDAGAPVASWRAYSASSKCPRDSAISPSEPNIHSSYPLMWTALPEPPGPASVPVSVQW